jgi:hypothetical protein
MLRLKKIFSPKNFCKNFDVFCPGANL